MDVNRKATVSSIVVLLVIAAGTVGAAAGLGNAASALKSAQTATAQAEHGTARTPNTTRRKVATGKLVCVVSPAQFLSSSSIPSNAAIQAIQAIGWKTCNGGKPYDANNNTSNDPAEIRAAIAAGANGIILDAIDCDTNIKPALQQAKAKHIPVVPIYGYDCNDPMSKPRSAPLFAGCVNFNNLACNNDGAFTETYGAAQANYIIAATKNKAKILELRDPEFIVLDYTSKGFEDQIAKSGGSKVVQKLNFLGSEVTGDLKSRVQNALEKDKSINWVKLPYGAATTFGGVGQAVHALGRNVMGGEGSKDEQSLIKSGAITAVNSIDARWTAWGAVDALNSVFTHQKTYPSNNGWTIVDKNHDRLPASGNSNVNFEAAYKKAWGK
jgi:ribose transport system substrate-binding protein